MDAEGRMRRGSDTERRRGGDTVPGALTSLSMPAPHRRRGEERHAPVGGDDDLARDWWSTYQALKDQ